GRAVLPGEVVKQPDRSHDPELFSPGASYPVRMQSLLPETRQRITPASLAQSEWSPKDMIDRCQHTRLSIHLVECRSRIHQIIDMTRPSSLAGGGSLISSPRLLECGTHPRHPIGANDFSQYDVALPIQSLALGRGERSIRDAALNQSVLDSA